MKRNNRYVMIALAALMTFFAASCDKTEMEGKGDGGSASGDAIGISALISDPQAKVDYAPKYDDNGKEIGIKLTWNANDVIFGYIVTAESPLTYEPLVYKIVEGTAAGKFASFESAADEDGKYGTHEVHTLTPEDEGKNIYFIAHSSTVPDAFWTDPTNFAVDLSVQNGIAINTNNTGTTTDDLIEGLNSYAYICATGQISDMGSKKEMKLIFRNQFAIMKYDTVTGLEAGKAYTFHLKGSGLKNKGNITMLASGDSLGFAPDGQGGEITAQITTGATGTVDNLFFVIPACEVDGLTLDARDILNIYEDIDQSNSSYISYENIDFVAGMVNRSKTTHTLVGRRLPVLPGLFTINAEGNQVHFSRGNLYAAESEAYYNYKTDTNLGKAEYWYFEDFQLNFRTCPESPSFIFHPGTLNLGTPQGTYGCLGIKSKIICWQVGDSKKYYLAGDGFPKITTATFSVLDTEVYDVNTDKGWNDSPLEKIQNELYANWEVSDRDKDDRAWRTLSAAEWNYLLNERTTIEKKWNYLTIKPIRTSASTVTGIIIYPDDYIGNSITGAIDIEAWTAAEINGCVFLPACGIVPLAFTTHYSVGECFYWATPVNSIESLSCMHTFSNYQGEAAELIYQYNSRTLIREACCVRLVTIADPKNNLNDLRYNNW